MRKVLAILLLAAFSLPFAQSLLALTPGSDANLPACCRRAGKHHCAMSAEATKLLSHKPAFRAALDKCPYTDAALVLDHQPARLDVPVLRLAVAAHGGAAFVVRAAETQRRVSRERSRHKRGPPAVRL